MWVCQHIGCQKRMMTLGCILKKDKVIFKSIISSNFNNFYIKNIVYFLSHIGQKKDKKDQIKNKNEFEGEGGNLNYLHKNPTQNQQSKKSVITLQSRYKADRLERHYVSAGPTHTILMGNLLQLIVY